jgi:putative transposase
MAKRVHVELAPLRITLRRKRRKQISGLRWLPMTPVLAPNERWSMDFVSDALSSGRRFRVLNIVDDYSKLSPAIEVDTSLPGLRVMRTLERAIDLHGKPKLIVMDNGPEFTCRALDEWASSQGIALHWIDPGKPMRNAFAESFNGRFREECLDQHHFVSLDDARALIESWHEDYNSIRPHTSLRVVLLETFVHSASEGSPSDAAPTSAQPHVPHQPMNSFDEHKACSRLGDRLRTTPSSDDHCLSPGARARSPQCRHRQLVTPHEPDGSLSKVDV